MNTPQDNLQSIVKHDGDCSCWKPDCLICDCGALRIRIREGTLPGQAHVWDCWSNHLLAIEAAIENPPLTKQEQRKLRVNQYGEPLDSNDKSNWEETTQP